MHLDQDLKEIYINELKFSVVIMNIEEQFNLIAKEYDANRKKFIPCFDDFYKSTTEFISYNINSPRKILDLGAGTGILTYYWYKIFPNSKYILVDIAEDMLEIAKKRFLNIENISYIVLDYSKKLPELKFDAIISALSIHHLENIDKENLFLNIYDNLNNGGIFVNYDQFLAGSKLMNNWFDKYWENQIINSGLTENDLKLWKERKKLDRECSAEDEIKMLNNCGFKEVKCVYSYQKFSVITCIK